MILDTIKTSLKSLKSNKTRTGLTVLGVVIGIASIIIVFAAGEGLSGLIIGQVESFGTDIVVTEVRVPTGKKGQTQKETQSATAMIQGVQITTMNLDDMSDVNKLENVKDSYGGIIGQEKISYKNESKNATILGVNSEYINIDKSEIGRGRYYTDEEDKSLAMVVVLGTKVAKDLFGEIDPIGKMIKVRKSKFRVIGVLAERGAVVGQDYDSYVYMPVRTLQKKLMGIDHLIYMVHQIYDLDRAEETAEEIRYLLRENHDIPNTGFGDPNISGDDFRVTTMDEMMSMLDVVTGALTLLLLAIVAISLLVGGVGIMNIMYVSVSERALEIGLRKAVGARYGDIMKQFLIESIIITLLGGIIGITIGILISYFISFGASSQGIDWKFSVPLRAFVTAICFSLVFGVIFGLLPAKKAARLNPVDAMRKT